MRFCDSVAYYYHCVHEKIAFLPIVAGNYWSGAAVKKYQCLLCSYVYDPEKGDPANGVPPGTAFEDVPDDWVCPECGAGKEHFNAF